MNILQKFYNWLKSLRYPAWLRPYVQELNDLMIALFKEAGQQYINYLKTKIIEAAQNKNWTSRERFEYVFKEAKKGFVEFSITLKDNELNTIINYLYTQLHKISVI